MNLRILTTLVILTTAAFPAHAQTAGAFDLVVGFKQTGATNDVMIDFGSVYNYYTAPGTYVLGDYDSILSANFGGAAWNASTTLNWGAAATWKDPEGLLPTRQWVTKQWVTTAGTLGMQNSTTWPSFTNSGLNSGNVSISRAYTGLGTYSIGVAETIATANINSWKTATTSGASAFNLYTQTLFQNQPARLALGGTFSASDLYEIGNTLDGSTTKFIGTFALYQNGELTFTVIPEPSTYAAIFGAAVLGCVMMHRRKQGAVL